MSRILVVENDEHMLDMMSSGLKEHGHECRSAKTVQEALETAKSWKPDAAVLDVNLEDGSGLEICKTLRASFDPIALLMISAHPQKEAQREIAALVGADAYLPKPFDLSTLAGRLKELLAPPPGPRP